VTGWNFKAKCIAQTVNVDTLFQTTDNQLDENLDIPDCEHMANEREERESPLSYPTHKEALQYSQCWTLVNTDDKVVKAMGVIMEFVSNILKSSLKQNSFDLYIQKQPGTEKF
jgi:hypothetical protein